MEPSPIESLLEIDKCFPYNILHLVKMESGECVHLFVSDDGKVSYVFTSSFDSIFFVVDLSSTDRGILYFKEMGVSSLVARNRFDGKKLIAIVYNTFVKSLCP